MFYIKKYQYIIYRLLIGGSNNSLSKIVVNDMSVSLFLLFRQLFALAILFVDFLFKKESLKNCIPINKDKNVKILILKLIVNRAIAVFAFYYALSKLPISFLSVSEASLSIIFTMLVSLFLLKEKYDLKKYFYILLLFIGVLLSSQIETTSVSFVLWIVLILNGLGIALDSYYSKQLINECTTNQLVLMKTFSAIPIAIIMYFILPNQEMTLEFIKNITLIYVFCFVLASIATYLSNLMIIRSIQEIGPTKTNVLTSTMPMISVLFAFVLFDERFTSIQFFGFILVMIGIFGFNFQKRK